MSGEIVLGVKDLLALVIGLGGPIAVYVGMREQITRLTAQVVALTDIVKDLREDRSSHGETIGDVREEIASLKARVNAIEQHRERAVTSSFSALHAETTGPHRTQGG